jgi:hypothetical protein
LTTQDVTQIGAGKKYGLFSSGARNKQNQLGRKFSEPNINLYNN